MKIVIQIYIILWAAFAGWGMTVRATDPCEDLWEKFNEDPNNYNGSIAMGCEYQKIDKELNRVYQEVLLRMKDRPVFIKNLKQEQRLWLKNRYEYMDFVYAYDEPGREAQVFHRPQLGLQLHEARTEYLKGFLIKNIYDGFSDEDN